jgi:TfoX/Sxy family transcriptional regulator of competence genes
MTKSKPPGATRRNPSPAKSPQMPVFTKPPSALVEGFERAVAKLPDTQPRKMFGYPAAFTGSQMFAGLFQDKMIVRLSDVDREALGREGARPFEPMPGRPMREYVVVPDAVRESPSALRSWLAKAHAYAATLPTKKKR